MTRWVRRGWLTLCLLMLVGCSGQGGGSTRVETDITLQSQVFLDVTGQLTVDQINQRPASDLLSLDRYQSFALGEGALWLRLSLPPMPPTQDWYVLMDASAFIDRATLHQGDGLGGWIVQQAGDQLPVSKWAIADRSPVFAIAADAAQAPVWLRIATGPAALNPRVYVLNETALQHKRHWTYLLLGGYLGFGVLVMFLGWVHLRLYRDRSFGAYVVYVGCMLGFQLSFTGIGALFFWPDSAWWANAAPSVFMLWLTASGIWFVREVCAVSRHSPWLDRCVLAWCAFGFLYPVVYLALLNKPAFVVLSLYGLLSVLLSIGLCLWTWRRGERYAGWMFLGFLPVHLGYPFPALRSAGLLPDSWATQYAVLIGSCIEIPVLLYILHRRAKEFSENRARMRALDHTDPLTGLTTSLVFRLRLRDAIRRARRYQQHCGLLLVELSNHHEFVLSDGREAGDRALVIAAARLTRVLRDVDTVCRVADTRFAVLVEGPQTPADLKLLAQHMVAKGLEPASVLPGQASLRFRLVSALQPGRVPGMGEEQDEAAEASAMLAQLHIALDEMATTDDRKVVQHLWAEPELAPPGPA